MIANQPIMKLVLIGVDAMEKPIVTLFMLMSVDGKISTGIGNNFDFDKDLSRLGGGICEGLQQYYDAEMETDFWSMNSGMVMSKVGCNENPNPGKFDVNFIIVDNTHLTEVGVQHFINRSQKFVLVTSNDEHPAFNLVKSTDNMFIYKYRHNLKFGKLFDYLVKEHNCDRLTVQTGGTLNGVILREGLFDYVSIVVAPLLVGGRGVPSLIDGNPISDLLELGALELIEVKQLKNSYLQLNYKVVPTIINEVKAKYNATSLF